MRQNKTAVLVLLLLWRAGMAQEECGGDLVWDECHTYCPFVCGREPEDMCPMVCVSGCGCPEGHWRLSESSDRCVESHDKCRLGGNRDDHGCVVGGGYTWCALTNSCVRTWETECCVRDYNGHCVPEGCRDWFDGCNRCHFLDATHLACTEMACLVNDDPECLDYAPQFTEGHSSSSGEKTTSAPSSGVLAMSRTAAICGGVALAVVVASLLYLLRRAVTRMRRGCDERTPLKATTTTDKDVLAMKAIELPTTADDTLT